MKHFILVSLAFILLLGCCNCANVGGPKAREQQADVTVIDHYVNKIDCPLCDNHSKLFYMGLEGDNNYLYREYLCEKNHFTKTVQLRSQSQQYIVISGSIDYKLSNKKIHE